MTCGECGRGGAVAVVEADDEGFVLVCEDCLNEFIQIYGELSLNYVFLTDLEGAVAWVVREANQRIKSLSKKVGRLLERGR